MRKHLIVLFLLGGLLAALSSPTIAQQIPDPDHVCFMTASSGQIVNLTSLCGDPDMTASTGGSNTSEGDRPPMFGNAGAGTVGFEAQLTSRSASPQQVSDLSYQIVYIDGVRNPVVAEGTAYVDTPEGVLLPGTTIVIGDEFDATEGRNLGRYFINALELRINYQGDQVKLSLSPEARLNYRTDENGLRYPGPCQFSWQVDAAGSRCGGRSATARAGGL